MKTRDGRSFQRMSNNTNEKANRSGKSVGNDRPDRATELTKQCHEHAEEVKSLFNVQGKPHSKWDPSAERARAKRIRLMQIRISDTDTKAHTVTEHKSTSGSQGQQVKAGEHNAQPRSTDSNNTDNESSRQTQTPVPNNDSVQYECERIRVGATGNDDVTRSEESSGPKVRLSERDNVRFQRWLDLKEQKDLALGDIQAPMVNKALLRQLRKEGGKALEEEVERHRSCNLTEQLQTGQQIKRDQRTSAHLDLLRPALEASLTEGTKKQKASLLRYWSMFCVTFSVDMVTFGKLPTRNDNVTKEAVRRECMILSGFASYAVAYPRKSKQRYNSAAYAERAVSAVRSYYEHMHGRVPGAGNGVDFTSTLRGVTRGLRKLYPTAQTMRVPLLADDRRAIRGVMDCSKLLDITFWALWASQWQGVMRSSDILRPTTDKDRKWMPSKDTHVGRILWEPVNPNGYRGCKTQMLWRLKPSKTDQAGETRFEETFLVDHDPNVISAGAAISAMLHKRAYSDDWGHVNIPLFLDPDTGKEVTINASRNMLSTKVREAGLTPDHMKGHSLRIGGATAYANSPSGGSVTSGFLGLWASGARWSYMHAYRRPLELAGLAVGKETVATLATRPGPVRAYAQGTAPR